MVQAGSALGELSEATIRALGLHSRPECNHTFCPLPRGPRSGRTDIRRPIARDLVKREKPGQAGSWCRQGAIIGLQALVFGCGHFGTSALDVVPPLRQPRELAETQETTTRTGTELTELAEQTELATHSARTRQASTAPEAGAALAVRSTAARADLELRASPTVLFDGWGETASAAMQGGPSLLAAPREAAAGRSEGGYDTRKWQLGATKTEAAWLLFHSSTLPLFHSSNLPTSRFHAALGFTTSTGLTPIGGPRGTSPAACATRRKRNGHFQSTIGFGNCDVGPTHRPANILPLGLILYKSSIRIPSVPDANAGVLTACADQKRATREGGKTQTKQKETKAGQALVDPTPASDGPHGVHSFMQCHLG
ncbi:hypothetical protein BGZ61DRAFT_471755 [Ilyonectria robusta]|uniref:uncharacterized protein n=1 Tax=Ilyonectria robusta TaxID=1079257 RepID=UPI001E8DDEC1|nr:uncharacterized protein BGZ61DRAFT_471755 [Ilyonectria robusta]KAH8738423.1 hypothetical protein BGZ61DRAFT_471755 [Ilyonectria robusta]